jgi:hypothetical protein
MKLIKIALTLSCITLAGMATLTSAHAMADTMLGGLAGIQSWNMHTQGGFAQNELYQQQWALC